MNCCVKLAVSKPNCSFCHQTAETTSHILFSCFFFFSNVFWTEVNDQILNDLKSCGGLSLEYCDVIIGVLKEEMDLFNYIVILGKSYLWTCRCKGIKPSLSHFKRILLNKYETEKCISIKSNNKELFKKKWKTFEDKNLINN